MGAVVAIGEEQRVRGFGLAGVRVIPAEDPAQAIAAWTGLPPDVDVVILTPTAVAAVADIRRAGWPLVAVMGE
jgi:vacuolar-type H+-ATPase subunit F/Vma7